MGGPPHRALVVGADSAGCDRLVERLRSHGCGAAAVASAQAALQQLGHAGFEVVVTMDDDTELVSTVARDAPDVQIVALSSNPSRTFASVSGDSSSIDVLADGADAEEILHAVDKALLRVASRGEEPPPARVPGDHAIVGDSKAMRQVHDLISRAAPGSATVLIRGESGTGKELVARAIHSQSPRTDGPFVKVHCAALPDNLLESELFGYEKGAFTGATTRKPGRVELAEGGTLFLDEIGDITPAIQVKLLRLLQDKEYERLGGTQTLKADVRFVTATHRDLDTMSKRGDFREDLFYRLNVVTIWLPPLRARRDDIEILANHFTRAFGAANGKPDVGLDESALKILRSQRWPGNVRQLQNFIEKLVVLAADANVTEADIRRELSAQTPFTTQATTGSSARLATSGTRGASTDEVLPLSEELRKAEKNALERALTAAKGNRTTAAKILGVSRSTLYNKLEEHGLD